MVKITYFSNGYSWQGRTVNLEGIHVTAKNVHPSHFPICSPENPRRSSGENWVGSPKMKEIKQKLCDARLGKGGTAAWLMLDAGLVLP